MKRILTTAVLTVSTMAVAVPALAATFEGTPGNDRIEGTTSSDLIKGYAGHDTLLGRGGADQINGHKDRDDLRGGLGNDVLSGGAGRDLLLGGDHGDTAFGGNGGDVVDGGGGIDELTEYPASEFPEDSPDFPDVMFGGPGNDFISVLDGEDEVYAGKQDDEIRVQNDGFRDYIRCGPGEDLVFYFSPTRDALDRVHDDCEDIDVLHEN